MMIICCIEGREGEIFRSMNFTCLSCMTIWMTILKWMICASVKMIINSNDSDLRDEQNSF